MRWEHLAIQLLWAAARLLITSISPIYLVDEPHILFLLFIPHPTHQQAGCRNLVYVECLDDQENDGWILLKFDATMDAECGL